MTRRRAILAALVILAVIVGIYLGRWPILRRLATDTPPVAVTATPRVVAWFEAKSYIGKRVTVEGPVIGTHYASRTKGKPTFINVGNDYPDSDRFVVLVWGKYRENFPQPPERLYAGKAIWVAGRVKTYRGVAQIVVTEPGQVEVVR